MGTLPAMALMPFVVDCTITRCAGTYGVAGWVNLIRTYVVENPGKSTPTAVERCNLLHCVLANNGEPGLNNHLLRGCTNSVCVGCTIAANAGDNVNSTACGGPDGFFNCVISDSRGTVYTRAFSNCVGYASGFSPKAVTNGAPNRIDGSYGHGQIAAPTLGDFRLATKGFYSSSGAALGFADARWLGLFPEEFRKTDVDGRPLEIDADGHYHAGAVQTTMTPRCGFRIISKDGQAATNVTVNGHPVTYSAGRTFLFDRFPVACEFAQAEGRLRVHGYELQRDQFGVGYRFPDSRGRFLFVPRQGRYLTVVPLAATDELWVDPKLGSDQNDGLSSGKPKRTLQATADSIADKSSRRYFVHLAPGEYAEGEKVVAGEPTANPVRPDVKHRLYYAKSQARVVFEGVEGAARTFICGARDMREIDGVDFGCGSNAVKCVRVGMISEGGLCLRGVTLTDAATGVHNSGNSTYGCGAALTTEAGSNVSLIECVISNNVGYACGATRNGYFYRCRFADNKSKLQGPYATINGQTNGVFSSCLFENASAVGAPAFAQQFVTLVGSTYRGNIAQPALMMEHGYAFDSIFDRSAAKPVGTQQKAVVGCAFSDFDYPNMDVAFGCAKGPARFVDPETGDYEPGLGSSAADVTSAWGNLEAAGLDEKTAWQLYYRHLTYDLDGNLPRAVAGEPALAGCVQRPAKRTIYVDAENGDDSADGQSMQTARKTLAAAMELASAGARVVALPGVYDAGEMLPARKIDANTKELMLASRVVLPAGVELVSREGADKTVIRGQRCLTGRYGYLGGDGDKMLRCVTMETNTVLKGFTLVDGATYDNQSTTVTVAKGMDNQSGGGVLALEVPKAGVPPTAFVRDCVISNCAASSNGGGACFAALERCRLFDDICANGAGSAAYHPALFNGCLEDRCRGAISVDSPFACVASTFGSHNRNAVGSGPEATGALAHANEIEVRNCIFLGGTERSSVKHLTNCVIPTGTYFADYPDAVRVNVMTQSVAVNQSYAPMRGTLAIDALDPSLTTDGVDVYGNPRVMGGRLDIGAVEFNWQEECGYDLSENALRITRMTSDVAEAADGRLLIRNGTIELVIGEEYPASVSGVKVNLKVLGEGVLTVWREGVVIGQYTQTSNDVCLVTSVAKAGGGAFSFDYQASAQDAGALVGPIVVPGPNCEYAYASAPGKLHYTGVAPEMTFSAYMRDNTTKGATGPTFLMEEENRSGFTNVLDAAANLRLFGELIVSQEDSMTARAEWTFVPSADVPTTLCDRISLYFALPHQDYCGGRASLSGVTKTIPQKPASGNANVFSSTTATTDPLEIYDKNGKLRMRLQPVEPCRIHFYTGQSGVSLRIYSLAPDGGYKAGIAYRVALLISAGKPVIARLPEHWRVVAGERGWVPVAPFDWIREGTALDLSKQGTIDAPAGKYGRVKRVGDHFEFENLPGVKQRFYGPNSQCVSSAKPEQSAQLIREFVRSGYNAVRIHHHENALAPTNGADKSCVELNPVALTNFDAYVAACVTNGIYLTIDLYTTRYPSWASIGVDRDIVVDPQFDAIKPLFQVSDKALENLFAFNRNLFLHKNFFTGRSLAEEPALISICVINEGWNGGLFTQPAAQCRRYPEFRVKWDEWLAEKRRQMPKSFSSENVPDDPPESLSAAKGGPAYLLFLRDLETKLVARARMFIREELKCPVAITDLNNDGGQYVGYRRLMNDEFDYLDQHFYEDHPQYLGVRLQMPAKLGMNNINSIRNGDMGAIKSVGNRLYGQPYCFTEYNYCAPGQYRFSGGLVFGAQAALQDWAGLWQHSYELPNSTARFGWFEVPKDPLMRAFTRAIFFLYAHQDMKPLSREYLIGYPATDLDKVTVEAQNHVSLNKSVPFKWAAWYARLGGVIDDAAPKDAVFAGCWPGIADKGRDAVLKDLGLSRTADGKMPVAGEGQVVIDEDAGSIGVSTPGTAGGFAEAGEIVSSGLTAQIGAVPAAIWASALDGKPLTASRRILLTHLTDLQQSGIEYLDESKIYQLEWGNLPYLMRKSRATVELSVGEGHFAVYGLARNGERRFRVRSRKVGDKLCFTADNAVDSGEATYLYEIIRLPHGSRVTFR